MTAQSNPNPIQTLAPAGARIVSTSNLPCAGNAPARTETLAPLARASGLRIEKCLAASSLLLLHGDHRGERIANLGGTLWITQAGSPEDVLLTAGESFQVQRKGALLVEGIGAAQLEIAAS